MYRFWLYCESYAPPEYDDGDDDRQAARNRAATKFLQYFTMDDCFEVAAAAAFCAELYGWNSRASNTILVGDPSGMSLRLVAQLSELMSCDVCSYFLP